MKLLPPSSQNQRSDTDVFSTFAHALRDLVVQVVRDAAATLAQEKLQQAMSNTRPLSPRDVARMAKVADKDVYDALKAGELKGMRSERGRWSITRDEAITWAKSIKRC
jgi:hypothetical protein